MTSAKISATVAGMAVFLALAAPAEAFIFGRKAAEEPAPPPPPPVTVHALATRAEPAYPPGFARFGYVSPYAEPGGRLTIGETGRTDSLNPFVEGMLADRRLYSPSGPFESYVFESLMVRSHDEPLAVYGLLAQSVTVPADRGSAIFELDPKARFSDGKAVTAEDVVFSAQAMREHGPPALKAQIARVATLEALPDGRVSFVFEAEGAEATLLAVAQMPILPKHVYESRGFGANAAQKMPVGTGPYRVASHETGRRLLYRLRNEYWAKAHPTRRGHFNFAEVEVRYFPNREAHFVAFQEGDVQVWIEDDAAAWEAAFNFFNARSGLIYREEFVPGGRRQSPGSSPTEIDRIARWVDIDRPRRAPLYGAVIDTWWRAYTN